MTREELQNLTIEKLSGMSEQQLSDVAHEVVITLTEAEIKRLPGGVRKKLGLKKGNLWELIITLVISAIAMSIAQLISGR